MVVVVVEVELAGGAAGVVVVVVELEVGGGVVDVVVESVVVFW